MALSKLSEKQIFQKENLKKCTSFEDQKPLSNIRGPFILALLSSTVVRLQTQVSDFFKIILLGR